MGISKKGYTSWEGSLRGRSFRWFTIARWGVKQTAKSKWLRRLVLVAWLPMLYYIVIFFFLGQLTEVRTIDAAKDVWQFQAMRGMFGGPFAEAFIADPTSFRPMFWSSLIHFFMHFSQIFVVMLVVALVGPKLISQDMASRSLAIYFAKPLTRFDYVLGKLSVVAFWVGMVSLAPALVIYGLSILFSPSTEALGQTWHIVPGLVGFSLLLMIGTGAPILALSSLTKNARFLGFLWAGFWVMSSVASFILSQALFPSGSRKPDVRGVDWTPLVSFSKNFDAVAVRFFDLEERLEPAADLSPRVAGWLRDYSYEHDWRLSLGIILTIAVVSLVIVTIRIGRPGEAGSK